MNSDPGDNTRIQRRGVLRSLGAAAMLSLAGCSGAPASDRNEPAVTLSDSASDAVFERVAFAGPNLVIELMPENTVTQLTLVAPDGHTHDQTRVTDGADRAELRLLSKVDQSYSAGDHELVAVTNDDTVSKTLSLQPDIQIVDIAAERDEEGHTTGRLSVTVENVGTGPTWVYNIGFPDAPSPNAPGVLDSPVSTAFELPEDPSREFITPGTERSFLKNRRILLFREGGEISCFDDSVTIDVIVQTTHGDISKSVKTELFGGYNIEDQLAARHPCIDLKFNSSRGD